MHILDRRQVVVDPEDRKLLRVEAEGHRTLAGRGVSSYAEAPVPRNASTRPRPCRRGSPSSGELFLDARGLARTLAEVVKLGASNVATPLDLDRGDQRAVGLERALDSFAARNLADDE